METLIQYLKDMQTTGKEVVSIQYVIDELKDIREDMRQTRYEPHTASFARQQHEYIIEAGWRAREAARGLRVYGE